MLFGARIEPVGDGYRLILKRQRRQWGALAWVVITAMLQDQEMGLFNFRMRAVGSGCIEFRTRACQFLGAAWKRWYKSGELRMPDMVIGDRELVFWILGSWKVGSKFVKLDAMGGSPAVKTPWPLVAGSPSGYVIKDITSVQAWLEQMVPKKILM